MRGLANRVGIAAVLCAAFLSVLVVESSAAAPPSGAKVSAAARKALNEIAAEAGYSSWAAYRSAREAEAAALQKEAARIIADALTYGRRVEKDYGEFGGVGLTGFTEYVIDFEGGQIYLRTGLEYAYPGFLGFGARIERTTVYWRGLEQLGSVTSVIEDGVERVVRVGEFVPGSIDVKPGQTRPVQKPSTSAAGTRPSSIDPKSDGSLGRASGGSSPLGGILDAVLAIADGDGESASDDSPEADTASPDEPSEDDGSEPASSSDPALEPGASKPDGSATPTPSVTWGETVTDEDGNKYTGFEATNDDGTTTRGTKTERADGTVTCHTVSKDGEQESECPSGLTDEPSCRSDCERLTFLAALFCDMCDANTTLPEKGSSYGTPASAESVSSGGTQSADISWTWPTIMDLDKAGGPVDYGDPNDPNAAAPIDWGNMFADPRNDGVTDPTEPGETAEMLEDSIVLAMLGTLRDPPNPPGADDEAPQPGGPPPGADE